MRDVLVMRSQHNQARWALAVIALAAHPGNARNVRYCKCENVKDTQSKDDFHTMCTLEASEFNVTGLRLSLRWADQNWGDKKGFFKICRRSGSGA